MIRRITQALGALALLLGAISGQAAWAWSCSDISIQAGRSISLGMLTMEQGRSGWVIIDAVNDGQQAATSQHVAISGWGDPPRTGEITVIGPAGARVEVGIDLFVPQDRDRDSDWVELRQVRVGDPPQSLDPDGPLQFVVDLDAPAGRGPASPDDEPRLVRRQIPIGMELELKKAQGGRQFWEREVVPRCLDVDRE